MPDPEEHLVCLVFSAERPWSEWEGVECVVSVTPLGGDRYRLEDVSALLPLQFHDEFEATPEAAQPGRDVPGEGPVGMSVIVSSAPADTPEEASRLVVSKRLRKSGFRRWVTVGRGGELQDPVVAAALGELVAAGGHWATEFGGVFVATWPAGFDFDALKRRVFGGSSPRGN